MTTHDVFRNVKVELSFRQTYWHITSPKLSLNTFHLHNLAGIPTYNIGKSFLNIVLMFLSFATRWLSTAFHNLQVLAIPVLLFNNITSKVLLLLNCDIYLFNSNAIFNDNLTIYLFIFWPEVLVNVQYSTLYYAYCGQILMHNK